MTVLYSNMTTGNRSRHKLQTGQIV